MKLKFYSWRLIGDGNNSWKNHIFPKGFLDGCPEGFYPSHIETFSSLCRPNFSRGALNGENKNNEYCIDCQGLVAAAEKEQQEKLNIKIAKREAELAILRPGTLEEIHGILNTLPTEKLLKCLDNLRIMNKK